MSLTKKIIYLLVIGAVILIGWKFPQFKLIYVILLLVWIGSWIFLGYCPITKWEFLLRRKYDKSIDPNAEAIKYYMYKFFNKDIPSKTIFTIGIIIFVIVLVLSLIR